MAIDSVLEAKVQAALDTLKQGKLIIVTDDEHREAEGDMLGLGAYVTPETVNFMTQHARGLLCAPMAASVAQRLDLNLMVAHNTEKYGTAFTTSLDHQNTTTGISAFDRATTIKALADPESRPEDFVHPGHMFPLIAKQDGIFERDGHTEAAYDLARLAGVEPVAYICEILKPDGHMARFAQLQAISKQYGLPLLTIKDLAEYRRQLDASKQARVSEKVEVKLPTAYGDFRLRMYTDANQKENLVLIKGDPFDEEAPLVRVHSECLTGDVFGSHRCDCGDQLHKAMALLEEEGNGLLIYLRQEGRGIGLLNKLRAYQLQEQGLDTYEANERLGFAPDERKYDVAAAILKQMGISEIRLLTNNPDKITGLGENGIEVTERVPLQPKVYAENHDYLMTKKIKFHHELLL